jgi:hypothetical protein
MNSYNNRNETKAGSPIGPMPFQGIQLGSYQASPAMPAARPAPYVPTAAAALRSSTETTAEKKEKKSELKASDATFSMPGFSASAMPAARPAPYVPTAAAALRSSTETTARKKVEKESELKAFHAIFSMLGFSAQESALNHSIGEGSCSKAEFESKSVAVAVTPALLLSIKSIKEAFQKSLKKNYDEKNVEVTSDRLIIQIGTNLPSCHSKGVEEIITQLKNKDILKKDTRVWLSEPSYKIDNCSVLKIEILLGYVIAQAAAVAAPEPRPPIAATLCAPSCTTTPAFFSPAAAAAPLLAPRATTAEKKDSELKAFLSFKMRGKDDRLSFLKINCLANQTIKEVKELLFGQYPDKFKNYTLDEIEVRTRGKKYENDKHVFEIDGMYKDRDGILSFDGHAIELWVAPTPVLRIVR